MRPYFLALLLPLATCSPEPAAHNNTAEAAPAPKPTGPAPRTPVTNVTPVPGESPSWMGARPAPHAPPTAPYGNLLDQPVVNGADGR